MRALKRALKRAFKRALISGVISVSAGSVSVGPVSATPSTGASTDASSVMSSEAPSYQARRVFALDLDQDGHDELLRVQGAVLSAHSVKGGVISPSLWETQGPGEVHLVSVGRVAGQRRVLLAWGMGVGQLKAPLTLTELNPQTGALTTLWRHEGPRSQAVHLEVLDQKGAPDQKGTLDQKRAISVRLAHFVSKYQTRALTLSGDPAQGPLTERVGRSLRMGTSWAYADVDGDGVLEEVVGRVYGDTKGEFGELSVYQGARAEVLPTERGVKALAWGQWGDDEGTGEGTGEGAGALYFSDGWVADYGKRARATLKRLRWVNGRAQVEQLATSPNEFTFFELWSRRVGGRERLFARGNKRLSLITPQARGPWKVTHLAPLSPVVNVALLHSEGRWWLASPTPRAPISLTELTHSALAQPAPSTEGSAQEGATP